MLVCMLFNTWVMSLEWLKHALKILGKIVLCDYEASFPGFSIKQFKTKNIYEKYFIDLWAWSTKSQVAQKGI